MKNKKGIKRMSTPEILTDRRNTAIEYMRRSTSFLWRAGEDIIYSQKDEHPDNVEKTLKLLKGRLYLGVPYSYAGGSAEAFIERTLPGADGIPTGSVSWTTLNGGSAAARLGNDCSGAFARAWSYAGADISAVSTLNMCPVNGYLHVGEFSASDEYVSAEEVHANPPQTMFEAYALLQPADGVVKRRPGSGHVRMVTSVGTVRTDNGEIDPEQSYVTIFEQTRGNMKRDRSYFDEKLGEDVYVICSNDYKITFESLYSEGYMPITNKIFIDPSPIPEPAVIDSLTDHSYETIFDGTLTANRLIDTLTMTIADTDGNALMSKTVIAARSKAKVCGIAESFSDTADNGAVGNIDLASLPHADGCEYRCTLVCRITGGMSFKVRDFMFKA